MADDGRMNKAAKDLAIQDITIAESNTDVMLVSLMAGGTGMRFCSIVIGFLLTMAFQG